MCYSGQCKYEQPMGDCSQSECLADLPKADGYAMLGEVTERMVDDACTWYRHDFGIMLSEEEKNKVRYEAKEWLLAWNKAFGHFA